MHRGTRVVPDVAPTAAGGLSGTSRVVTLIDGVVRGVNEARIESVILKSTGHGNDDRLGQHVVLSLPYPRLIKRGDE